VQAYLKGCKQLVVFDDVDVLVMVEREMGHVIRRANHKTYLEIHQEIRSVQARPAPPNKGIPPLVRFMMLLP
jgi:excinuclease UvrABC ATPase subunit